ncbi:MAG TPA: RimK-like protein [Candidatus Saccharimonadia bacterium]|nr:RimK-like protein [Candidatus Saccharimonadia bacterium]
MSEANSQRALVALLKKVCQRRGIQVTSFSDDWLFCLQKDDQVSYIFGYDFGVNNASAKMICKDKAATSDLLGFHKVPRIEHRIFHGPQLAGFVTEAGGWEEMLAYLAAHPQGVVCKPNEGTGGNAVYFVNTAHDLETAVYQVFAKSRSLCLSPFEDFEHEYRVALLDGKIEFVYRKVRPSVRGDGKRSIRDLFLSELAKAADFSKEIAGMRKVGEMDLDWSRVPASGETVKLNWRHNLGQGAKAEMLTPKQPEAKAATKLALAAAKALGVKLASVDIAATPEGLKVLEINSGIMMESLVKIHPKGQSMAARFYDRIICMAMDIERDQ